MPRYIVFPYRMASESARAVARLIGAIRVHPNGRYRPRQSDIIINWGNGSYPSWYRQGLNMLNDPQRVQVAQNKLSCLQTLRDAGVPTPEFTTSREVARTWNIVYARTMLRASEGRGIVVVDNPQQQLPNCNLYTKHITPDGEYRVHLFKGQVIDYSKKVRVVENEGFEPSREASYIRNHSNGWHFVRGVNPIQTVIEDATSAINAVGLDFGSVDIIRRDGRNYVLEINTASGLSDMGATAYANAIMRL